MRKWTKEWKYGWSELLLLARQIQEIVDCAAQLPSAGMYRCVCIAAMRVIVHVPQHPLAKATVLDILLGRLDCR